MEKGYMMPDIIEVKTLNEYNVEITYDTNEKRIYNMKNLIEHNKYYSKLKDRKYFENVKPRGDTIEWENGEDVCPENLYYNSKKV